MTVKYPSKRIFSRAKSGGLPGYANVTDDTLEWLSAHGWNAVSLAWDNAKSDNVSIIDPYLELINSYGLDVFIEIEAILTYGVNGFTISTPVNTYGTTVPVGAAAGQTLSDIIALYEDDDRIVGFGFEGSFDNGVQWLVSQTDKIITQYYLYNYGWWNGTTWSNEGAGALLFSNSSGDMRGWRLLNVDELVVESFFPDECTHAGSMFNYCRANFPKLKLGFISSVDETTWWQLWQTYAYYNAHKNDNPLPDPPTYDAVKALAAEYLTGTVRSAAGRLDIGMVMTL